MGVEFRRWLEGWLGIEPVAAGEDTQWQLRYALGWPDWVLALFVAGSIALILWVYLRESPTASRGYRFSLAALRIVIVAVVLLMLGQLELIIDRTGLPYLVILVDDSESMSIKDHPDPSRSGSDAPSRLEQVQSWLTRDEGKPLARLTSQHKIQVHAVSSTPRLLGTWIDDAEIPELIEAVREIKPDGTESRMGGNLRSILNSLRGTPPSAVVLVTDGIVTHGEALIQSAQYAARKNIPIFTVGTGDPGEVRDWELRDLLVDDTVFVGDLVTFQAKIRAQGLAGESATVRLERKSTGEVVDSKNVVVPESGDSVDVELTFRPEEPGADDYVVVIPADTREQDQENNRAERRIEAIKEKIRVLYVESYPRYEFRFLKNLLEREETIEFQVLLADSDPEYLEEDRFAIGYFPTSQEDLFAYDVIILGDVSPALLSTAQLDQLREFVRSRGGGLMFIAGTEFSPRAYRDTPLGELLPVSIGTSLGSQTAPGTSAPFVPRLTIEGQSSPIFRFGNDSSSSQEIFSTLPGIYWYGEVEQAKPAAAVLAEHPSALVNGVPVPLVATQFYGAGRTIYQGFTGTWRWRNRVEDLYFARYWIQSIRLLSRSKLLGKNRPAELLLDRRTYRRGDPVQILVRLVDESILGPDGEVTVTLERMDGASRTIRLTRRPGAAVYEGIFAQTEDGPYRVRLRTPTVDSLEPAEFKVVPPPGELDRVRMNEAELKAVAEATGGQYFPIDQADKLYRRLPTGRKVSLHTDPPIELWNQWPILILLVSLLTIEWIMRKRRSLL